MPPSRQRLVQLLRERSLRRGSFVLSSGRTSDFYVDARQVTLCAEGAWLVASLVLSRLEPGVLGVGGPTVGADPIAGAIAASSWAAGHPVHGFLVRKQPKAHGERRWVEGRANLPDGSPVCLVEDTTTSGASLLRALERVRAEGLVVVQALTVVDRQEGAVEALAAVGLRLDALATCEELLR